MVIINGHGGNTFKSIIRDLSLDYPDFLLASSEWFAFVPAKEYFDEPGDHADELETSVMMHYHPELVNLDEAGNGDYKKFTSQMLNEKVAMPIQHTIHIFPRSRLHRTCQYLFLVARQLHE